MVRGDAKELEHLIQHLPMLGCYIYATHDLISVLSEFLDDWDHFNRFRPCAKDRHDY